MREGSMYSFCVSATIFMIIVSLSINFISALGIFGLSPIVSPITNETTGGVTDQLSNGALSDLFSGNIIGLVVGAIIAVIGAILLILITQSITLVGVYLFGVVFWTAWGNCLWIFNINGIYGYPGVAQLFLIITVAMVFIFAGAVIGLISGGE